MFLNHVHHTGKHSAAFLNCLCRVKWQVDVGMILKRPAKACGLVIAARLDHGSTRNYGFLRAFNADTGGPNWQFADKDSMGVAGGITTRPVVADGLVLFGSGEGWFKAVDLSSGQLVWEFATGGGILANPTVSEGTVYFGNAYGTAYALDVLSGTCLWEYKAEGRIYAPVAISGSTVYVADEDGHLYALSLAGNLLWQAQLEQMRPISIVLSGDLMIISDLSQGALCAFELTKRRQVWSFQFGGESVVIPAIAAGIVCVSGGGKFAGIDLNSGKTLWVLQTEGNTSPPVIVGRTAVVARRDGMICGIDIVNGAECWTCETGQNVLSEILVDDGMLYFGSGLGRLVALELIEK
jgi:outer membrane protein assembly factor BamB